MTVSRTAIARLAMLVCFTGAGAALFADEWPAPQVREIFSPSRSYFVRVTPGDSWGDVFGFGNAPKGLYATAQFYERRDDGSYVPVAKATLSNPIAPVEYFVSDRGCLFTLDNWHNMGYGKVFNLYSPGGVILHSYELADLFSKEEIDQFEHSASSIQWHRGPSFLQPDQKSLFVTIDLKGGGISFDAENGLYRYCEWHGKEFVCRISNTDRIWRPFNAYN